MYAMYQYLELALIIKFTTYKILVAEGYFNFIRFSSFGCQDLGVVAVVVAIVHRTCHYHRNPSISPHQRIKKTKIFKETT